MPRSPQSIPESTMRLILAPGLGPVTLRRLRETFSSDDAIAGASISALMQVKGIARDSAESLRRAIDESSPQAERDLMGERDASLVLHGDEDYPPLLATIPDPPAALWIRGELADSDRLAVAIVGSRRCTPYGREQAARFASLLAQSGLTIVSGGALGIDGEAHRGALRVNGRTIAVLGCGVSRAYPPEHAELFDRIADGGGCALSELPMDSPPVAGNFPRRNRIISGMSLGVLVIEAAKRSGALITARLAAEEHHREVMALPGRVDSPASAGCLGAVKDGWASLVLDHADVLRQLDGCESLVRGALEAAGHTAATTAATLFDGSLSPAQKRILAALDDSQQTLSLDQIVARTELPLSQVMGDLTLLEIQRRVKKDASGFHAVASAR